MSVGNVGQLAADLLVATLRMQRVGWVSDHTVLPLVGNDAFDHTPGRGIMHTAAEGEITLLTIEKRGGK